jgi:hypothetical protein
MMRAGGSGYLVGCRGMGKTVFMNQLKEDLRGPEREVFMFPTAGPEPSIAASIRAIADEMVKASSAWSEPEKFQDKLRTHSKQGKLRELFDLYLAAAPPSVDSLVLLYDELDAYAGFGRPFFSEIEDIRKNANGSIVIFAAGGLGLVALDTLLGSSFFSRLMPEILEPFDMENLTRLAEPFEERGSPLSLEVLETLLLATGGNVALATFGLQNLWPIDAPSARDVTEVFIRFQNKHTKEFIDKIRDPVFDSEISSAPERVWRALQRSSGRMTQEHVRELIKEAKGKQRIKVQWVFDMLRSTGLIRAADDAYRRANIEIEIIPSILTLDVQEAQTTKESLREQLVADLCEVLASIHRTGPDFFFARSDGNKQIVPESVLSAILVLSLEPRGWKVEREAQSGAGRTDIKARHAEFGERAAVIEIKLWGRNDHEVIHLQVTDYWSDGVEALATVMVADLHDQNWPDTYEEKCLRNKVPHHERRNPPAAVTGHFVARTEGCPVPQVDHFLLRLPRRR